MELRHRKNIIEFYITMKIKTNQNVLPFLEKLTRDRFRYWNFKRMEEEILIYFIHDLEATPEDAKRKINQLKNDI